MGNNVTVDSRYMKYKTKEEVEALLDKVNNADAEPTAESKNMISSGAVYEAMAGIASVGDKVGEVPDEEPEEES